MKDFNKLFSLLKPFKKEAFLVIFFNALSVLFALFSYTMVIPFLRLLFNSDNLVSEPVAFSLTISSLQHNLFYILSLIVAKNGAVSALVFVSFIVVVSSMLKNLFVYLHKHFLAPMINGVAKNYQNKIFSKLVTLPLAFFSEERKGNLMSRMTGDVYVVRDTMQHVLIYAFIGPISLIMFLGFLFYASFKLTIFVLVFLPIMGFIIIKISRNLKTKSYKGQQIQGEILNNTEEVITGLRIIKAFNAEKKIKKRFENITTKYFKTMNSVERKIWLASPMSEFLATIIIMVIMYVGGLLVLGENSTLSSEAFIAYLIVFSQVIPPAKNVINAYYSIQKGLAAVQRIDEIILTEDKIIEKENPIVIKDFSEKINYENVTFSYQEDFLVLDNINLEIKKGQTIAIVGESGSGKSTLVDLLPRFYDIKVGALIIDGNNIKDMTLKSLRDLFGIVSQTSILFNDTIENNIAFGVENYTKEQLIEAAKIANAYDFIMEKPEGFQTNIGDGGTKLSGGQRQRISIARAVLKNPPILILDEATSSLDTESEKLVQDALSNIMKNRTAIVIAHRLSTVKNADLIYVLHEGRIIEKGKHQELIEFGGVYQKLVEMQMM